MLAFVTYFLHDNVFHLMYLEQWVNNQKHVWVPFLNHISVKRRSQVNYAYTVRLVFGQVSGFICEEEDKEQDQKQSVLKPHLDFIRKTNSHLSEKSKSTGSFWKPNPEGFGVRVFFLKKKKLYGHPFSVL